jgi:hypothetical protein
MTHAADKFKFLVGGRVYAFEKRNTESTETHRGHREKQGYPLRKHGLDPGGAWAAHLDRGKGAPGITSGYAGSRLRRARATRTTTPPAVSMEFHAFRDQPSFGGPLDREPGISPWQFSASSVALCVLRVPSFSVIPIYPLYLECEVP